MGFKSPGAAIECPHCLKTTRSIVTDSRARLEGVKRRRECKECGSKVSTIEIGWLEYRRLIQNQVTNPVFVDPAIA